MTDPTSTPKNILTIGLVLPPSLQTLALQALVKSNLALANQSGYLAEPYMINTADADPIVSFEAHLKQKTWDGILIGWGIRGNPELSEMFEKIVNKIVETQKPVPKFLFSLKPDGLMEALERVFGKNEEEA